MSLQFYNLFKLPGNHSGDRLWMHTFLEEDVPDSALLDEYDNWGTHYDSMTFAIVLTPGQQITQMMLDYEPQGAWAAGMNGRFGSRIRLTFEDEHDLTMLMLYGLTGDVVDIGCPVF